ncbi:unnamed protein product, partial [Rotaria sordida]
GLKTFVDDDHDDKYLIRINGKLELLTTPDYLFPSIDNHYNKENDSNDDKQNENLSTISIVSEQHL